MYLITSNLAMKRFVIFVIPVLLATFSYPVISKGKENGPVAAYGFEENSSVVTDSSDFGNNGTASGATWTSKGRYGAAFSFDGDRDTVTVSDNASLDIAADLTIEAWLYPDDERNGRLVTKMSYPNSSGYDLLLWNAGYNLILGSAFDRTTGAYEVDRWQHVALVKSGTTAVLYKNGLPVTTWIDAPTAIGTNDASLIIGGAFSYFFRGIIDEVRIYNQALTQEKIQFDMDVPVVNTDAVPPTIVITAPQGGETTSGMAVTVSAAALDNVRVATVTFAADGITIGAEDATVPYSITWDTTTVKNGSHTLTATARDAAGNTTISTGQTVQVQNGSQGTENVSSTPPQSPILALSGNLGLGMIYPDVRRLKEFLQELGYFSKTEGTTELFDKATKDAVISYQKAKAIEPASGFVGPLTRAAMAGATASLSPTPPAQGSQITRKLIRGLRGDDVLLLQKTLQSAGFFPIDQVITGYFGSITQEAVRAFQCAKTIICSGDPQTTGYGAVGPRTRAALTP